jgi:hypothetical protein
MKNNLLDLSAELINKIKSLEGFKTPLIEEELIRSLAMDLDELTSTEKGERVKALHNMFALGQVFSGINKIKKMNKEEYTLEEKLDFLEEKLGYRPVKTELHSKEGMGSFEWEVNQDFKHLFKSNQQ